MSCPSDDELLTILHEGRSVPDHVSACAACAARLAEWRQLEARVAEVCRPVPFDIEAGRHRLLAAITAPAHGTASSRYRPYGRRAITLAVWALALSIFAFLIVSLNESQASHASTRDALMRTEAERDDLKRKLVRDGFDLQWLDPTRWKTGRRKTTMVDGYARLNDRGSLVTVAEYPDPLAIELDWRWIDIAGDIAYRDTLTVALHTAGEHEAVHPFRIRDGIEITFQAHAGRIAMSSVHDFPFDPVTPEGSFPMPDGKWHHARIVDDGRTIAVFFAGPSIPDRGEKPVIQVPYVGGFPRHRIAIFNREVVAGALHESHIKNVTIRALK